MMRPTDQIVTRFAPSPTGYLHIGGARTALFNWAFARRHGGVFILRMEDTDVVRSTADSTRRIIEDMAWLGINWDEGPDPRADDCYKDQRGGHGPYFQSQRGEMYGEFIQKLHAIGRAYRCFKTPQQLTAEREQARAAGRKILYDPAEALSRSEQEQQRLIAEGAPYVWRFRMPDADVTVSDLVLGEVTIRREELEDFVIIKSSALGGGPTFHFANVVDDATMGVTHVIRAQEHLMNTPKHVAMFDALGLPRPRYGHMPLIFNADGTKMSKRDKAKTARQAAKQRGLKHVAGVDDKALAEFLDKKSDDIQVAMAIAAELQLTLPEIDVHDFRVNGYLPEVINNYISLLGWSPGGDIEKFDNAWLAEHFKIEGIGKSNARFDRDKLFRFNGDAIAALSMEAFVERWRDYCRAYQPAFIDKLGDDAFARLAAAYKPRVRTLKEPCELGRFFIAVDDAIVYDDKAVEKVLRKDGGFGVLSSLRPEFAALEPWNAAAIEALVKAQAESTGLGLGKIAQPIRVAVSGSTVSPGIGETLEILGKASMLARIDRCLALA